MKFFNCGLPKTGTSSFHAAMQILHIRSAHSAQIGQQFKRWLQDKSSQSADAPLILNKYDAFGDGPFWTVTLQLLKRLPDSKVAITKRDKESWITSMMVHVLANRLGATAGVWTEINTQQMSQTYDRAQRIYDQALREFPHRVIELNFAQGDDWPKLCNFVGRPIPSVPFPHENTGIKRIETILDRLKQRRSSARDAATVPAGK